MQEVYTEKVINIEPTSAVKVAKYLNRHAAEIMSLFDDMNGTIRAQVWADGSTVNIKTNSDKLVKFCKANIHMVNEANSADAPQEQNKPVKDDEPVKAVKKAKKTKAK